MRVLRDVAESGRLKEPLDFTHRYCVSLQVVGAVAVVPVKVNWLSERPRQKCRT